MKTRTKRLLSPLYLNLLICIFLVLCGSVAMANQVTATGQGVNRAEALRDAQRNAVEQGVGAMLDSSTITQNSELLRDRVYSSSHGYVTNYSVVNEGQRGNVYEVTISARVDNRKLENDINALRIFQQKTFDRRRVMVIFSPFNERNSVLARAAISEMQDVLGQRQFRVFDQTQMERIYVELTRAAQVFTDDIMKNAVLQREADVIFVIEGSGGQSRAPWGGVEHYVTLDARAFETSTGRLYGRTSDQGRSAGVGGSYAVEQGLANAARDAANKVTAGLVDRITTSTAAQEGLAVFNNLTTNEMYNLLDAMVASNLDCQERSVVRGMAELDCFDVSSNIFRRTIIDLARRQGISLEVTECVPSRCTFLKEGTARF